MYQGHLLMDILNWAGLVVNGLVASILPLVLAYVAYKKRTEPGVAAAPKSGTALTGTAAAGQDEDEDEGEEGAVDVVRPLSEGMEPYRAPLLLGTIGAFAVIIVSTLVLDVVTGSGP